MSIEGLSSESRVVLDAYHRWARVRQESFSRELAFEADSFAAGNLLQVSFNRHEVEEILRGQLGVLSASVAKHMQLMEDASADLCSAILYEADVHRMPISVDAASVLSKAVGSDALEKKLVGGPKGKLAPLTAVETGGEAGRQLGVASDEIRRLNEKVKQLTVQLSNVMSDKSQVTSEMLALRDQLQRNQQMIDQQSANAAVGVYDSAALEQLRAEVAKSNAEMSNRLSQTTQYRQIKSVIEKKNREIRELRSLLSRYDPAYAHIADDLDEEED
jgi:leucine zipper transcription factor-like protein 1